MHNLKIDFRDKKIFFKFRIGSIQIDVNQIFPMKPLALEKKNSVESYNKKKCTKCIKQK